MEFSIKKKNLKWIILGILLVIALSFGIGLLIQQSINEKRASEELTATIDRAINREYKSLIREYESYKETIEDHDYSYEYRKLCISKIKKLVEKDILDYDMDIDSDEDQQIREELHSIARKNAYRHLLE